MNRNELQEAYISELIESMDVDTLIEFVYEKLNDSFSNLSEEELITEVEEHYPELLENN